MSSQALEGIRIISMGSVWAGPYVGRVLAECGAEVIRVAFFTESPPMGTPETIEQWKASLVSQGMTPEGAERATITVPTYPALYACQQLSLGIDLRQDRGKEIYKELMKVTDVVVDGFSSRVMTNLGLDYAVLKEVKPDIIYVSIPALGMTGDKLRFLGRKPGAAETGQRLELRQRPLQPGQFKRYRPDPDDYD